MDSITTPARARLLFLALFAILGLMAGQAQKCSIYYPLEQGVRLEYAMYDKNGKDQGSQWQEVREVQNTPDGLEASMAVGFVDKKGKESYQTEYRFTCNGSTVRIDYESLLSGEMLEQYGEMDLEISGTDIEVPNNLSVGQELPDASVLMKVSMSGINMNFSVDMTGRKVEKKEAVTTPAGTFDCFVLYSENQSKAMMANQSFPSRTWIAEDVGMVKSETYNKNGKTISSMVLTAVTR